MRVTNRMLTDTVLNNINTNLERLSDLENKTSSGKMINRPSDDPAAVARLLSFKSVKQTQDQYEKNMRDAQGWLDTTDGALQGVNTVLQRARELAVYGSNGTMPDESRKALAEEVDKLVEEMVQVGNTNYGGRYIFAGSHTTEPPFEAVKDADGKISDVKFINGSIDETKLDETYKLEFEVEARVKMNVSAGKLTFHTGINGEGKVNVIFDQLIDLRKNLEKGDTTAISDSIGDYDKLTDNLLSELSIVGAKSKRMETAQARSFTYQLDVEKIVGKLEDVDYSRTMIDYKSQKATYEAALNAGAKIILPSLGDYLK